MTYTVKLASVGNPDFGENPNRKMPGVPNQRVQVDTIEDAQAISRAYIEQYDLGGGNWAGGEVTDENGEYVGRISYNGRFWPKEGT